MQSKQICFKELIQLRFCSRCLDLIDPTICLPNCIHKFSNCTQFIIPLESDWMLFIGELLYI